MGGLSRPLSRNPRGGIGRGVAAMARSHAAKMAGQARYMARRAAFHDLYEPAGAGGACVYCDGPAESADHVPPLAVVASMPAGGRAGLHLRLVPSCRSCNAILSRCASGDLWERRALVADVRSGARDERRRAAIVAGYRVLVRRPDFEVRLTGWRNGYVAFVRDGDGAWEKVASGGSASVLRMSLCRSVEVSDAILDACSVLPELATDVPPGIGLLKAQVPGSALVVDGELFRVVVPRKAASYVLYARAMASADWERLFSSKSASGLVKRCRLLAVPAEVLRCCEGLPERPEDGRHGVG